MLKNGVSFLLVILISCSRLVQTEETIDEVVEIHDMPENAFIAQTLIRAQRISQISWTPLRSIPNNSGYFPAGVTIKGIPYSSVKEIDKFVGLDVSFVTFMTALHNPRSVLYTENISKPPYKGSNCATYYGTVCSSTVDYALGLRVPYSTSMIETIPLFKKSIQQAPEFIQLGDLLLSKGHVVMVYDIIRYS